MASLKPAPSVVAMRNAKLVATLSARPTVSVTSTVLLIAATASSASPADSAAATIMSSAATTASAKPTDSDGLAAWSIATVVDSARPVGSCWLTACATPVAKPTSTAMTTLPDPDAPVAQSALAPGLVGSYADQIAAAGLENVCLDPKPVN